MKKIVMTILFISLFLISGCDGIQNNSITSPIMDSYYITIDSDKYSLISGDSNDYIFTKSNKEIANITYITQSYVNKNIKTLKKSKNIDILSEVYSDKNNGYCFFKNKNTNTYYYLLVYPHSAVLLQSNLSKKETRKILQKISIVECNEANDSVIPIVFPIDS